jgi:hypothetical protein
MGNDFEGAYLIMIFDREGKFEDEIVAIAPDMERAIHMVRMSSMVKSEFGVNYPGLSFKGFFIGAIPHEAKLARRAHGR